MKSAVILAGIVLAACAACAEAMEPIVPVMWQRGVVEETANDLKSIARQSGLRRFFIAGPGFNEVMYAPFATNLYAEMGREIGDIAKRVADDSFAGGYVTNVAPLAAATAASAGSVAVGTPEELAAALAAAARDQSAPHEIAVKAGRYLLERPLEVSAVTGLVLRAERSGEVELCGGVKVTGWSRVEGTPFWAADAKGTDGKPAFFRALAKNGDWVKTAVVPGGTNRFEHSARFGAFLLPNLAGHWSRPPTDDENRVMPYDAKDIPDSMDLASADIHLLHMWSDSLCTVESIDRAAKVVKVKETPDWPMGAQGKFEYEIFNVREGMAPGRWFLDRRAGRVYYQPLPGEEVEKLDFIRPALRHVLVLNGGCDVRIEGIAFSGATPACGDGSGFGGISAPAAVVVRNVDRLALRGVEIRNTAGAGLNIGGSRDVVVDGCSISSCGACAAFISGGRVVVRRTLVGDAGLVHRASCGIFASGSDLLLAENEVRNVPYSGLIVFGERNRVETNFIHHVMQVLHDGAAVYGLFVDGAIRGNVVKDVVACGTGFGVHAYYADENSRNTVVEDNYAEGIPVPIHNRRCRSTTTCRRGSRCGTTPSSTNTATWWCRLSTASAARLPATASFAAASSTPSGSTPSPTGAATWSRTDVTRPSSGIRRGCRSRGAALWKSPARRRRRRWTASSRTASGKGTSSTSTAAATDTRPGFRRRSRVSPGTATVSTPPSSPPTSPTARCPSARAGARTTE